MQNILIVNIFSAFLLPLGQAKLLKCFKAVLSGVSFLAVAMYLRLKFIIKVFLIIVLK